MIMEDLLKILDMNKEEQESQLRNYAYNHREESHWYNYMNGHISLADLAFRLRDEAVNKNYSNWLHAGQTVYDYTKKELPYRTPGYLTWFSVSTKPIHWIIAALIAKDMVKD